MRRFFAIASLVLLGGCAAEPAPAASSPAGAPAAAPSMAEQRASLEKAELDFAADTAARGVEGWVAAFAEDGMSLDPKGHQTKGKDQIRAKMIPVFAEVKISWKPTFVDVAPGGQMGFTYGLYEVTPRAGEQKVLSHGAYLTVWKRDSTGAWKVAADLGAQDRDKPPEQ